MNESPVLIHVWQVDPAAEAAAVARLEVLYDTLITDPAFVSGRILESADSTSIATVAEMRSVEDRQRVQQRPEVREILAHLDGTANVVVRVYHEVRAYQLERAQT